MPILCWLHRPCLGCKSAFCEHPKSQNLTEPGVVLNSNPKISQDLVKTFPKKMWVLTCSKHVTPDIILQCCIYVYIDNVALSNKYRKVIFVYTSLVVHFSIFEAVEKG